MQRRKQRSRLHHERALGHLLDSAGHAEAVQLARGNSLQNQQIKGALQQGGAAIGHRRLLLSPVYTSGRPAEFQRRKEK
jgi:hypothetical protein